MAKAIKTLLIFCLLTISLAVEAQQRVTGQITNAQDGTPMSGASVFISGTTISTQSDRDGNFSLTVPIQGSFQVVVSHIGFESVSRTIDLPQPSHHINVALQEQATVLSEVVVTPGIPHTRSDENLFWQILLGERPSNRGMQVLNPDVVQFSLNADGVLRVFADEPIEIINHHLGYRITYVLLNFTHNSQSEETLLSGMPFFTELTPQNNRQRNSWESNRQITYSASLIRFIRALYQEQLHENGFLLVKIGEPTDILLLSVFFWLPDHPVPLTQSNLIPLSLTQANILQRDEDVVRLHITETIVLAMLSRPITPQMLEDPNRTLFGRRAAYPIIKLLPLDIVIFSDGSYSGVWNISEYRGSITGLNAKLPIEFGMSENTVQ